MPQCPQVCTAIQDVTPEWFLCPTSFLVLVDEPHGMCTVLTLRWDLLYPPPGLMTLISLTDRLSRAIVEKWDGMAWILIFFFVLHLVGALIGRVMMV